VPGELFDCCNDGMGTRMPWILTFCRYEWIEIALLHKNLFASRWMQSLSASLGHSFPADNAFALLYIMYNPVCRKDIIKKNRLFTKLLAEALHPVHKEYLGQAKNLGFYIKSSWVMLKFAIQNRALADCNPTLVLAASEQPHATLLKDVNRALLLVNSQERDAKTNWKTAKTKILSKMKAAKGFLRNPNGVPSAVASLDDGHHHNISQPANASIPWFEKIQNCWKRSNRVVPIDPNNEQRYDDPPKLFVDTFALEREFLQSNVTESATLSLLTMMIFNEADDFGSSRDCKRYRQKFDANLVAFQKTFQALFCLSKKLEFADSSDKISRLTFKERMLETAFDMIFGKELKLLRNFNRLSDKEIAELFLLHDFPELDVEEFSSPSVDAVLKQLLAADEEELAAIHRSTAAEAQSQVLLNRNAALSDELRFANAGTAAALERAAALDAQVRDSAADVARLSAEVDDLQTACLAALQLAAATELEVQTLSDALRFAKIGTAAALEQADASDAEVKDSAADVARLSAQVKDLHAELLSAIKAAGLSFSAFEVLAEFVDPSVENVEKLVDDSIQQQVRRTRARQSATGTAAIAALTRTQTAHVMKAPSPALSHLGNDAFVRHNFAAPSKNRSSEALPPFTKARQPQCECSCG